MSKMKWIAMLAAGLALGLSCGCDSGDDDEDGGGSGGGTSDSYAGTWTGNVCGRGLTMVLSQNGTSLSGTYNMADNSFTLTAVFKYGSMPLDMTYNNARLICRPETSWIKR